MQTDAALPHLTAPKGGYVFVVTYGRSGSTLLQNLLNSFDGYCIRGENNAALQGLYLAYDRMRASEPMRGVRNKGERTEPTHPWYGAERTNLERLAKGFADVFVREVLCLPEGTRVGGFKEIRYNYTKAQFRAYLQFIATAFPNAKFVFNTRDLDQVAKSGWWREHKPEQVRAKLRVVEANFEAFAKNNPDICISMNYNEYCNDREKFRELFNFLGEPWDPILVDRILDRKLTHLKA